MSEKQYSDDVSKHQVALWELMAPLFMVLDSY